MKNSCKLADSDRGSVVDSTTPSDPRPGAPRAAATSEDALARAFEACTLAPADFGHAEHVRLAWHYLEREPLLSAAARLCEGLRRYTRAIGAAGKYHETVTLAWLLLVHERRRCGDAADWPAFRRANPDLFDPEARPLAAYYRPETLKSALARRRFVLPDRGLSGASRDAPGAGGLPR